MGDLWEMLMGKEKAGAAAELGLGTGACTSCIGNPSKTGTFQLLS